jgi:hypothetical protein
MGKPESNMPGTKMSSFEKTVFVLLFGLSAFA